MPEQSSPIDKVRSLVLGYARQLLADLLKSGAIPRPESTVLLGDGWRLHVSVGPSAPGEGNACLTEIEREVLDFLAKLQQPMSAKRLTKAMERHYGRTYAEITIKRALAKLKGMGLVGSTRKGIRGYFLLDNIPLFQLPVPTDEESAA